LLDGAAVIGRSHSKRRSNNQVYHPHSPPFILPKKDRLSPEKMIPKALYQAPRPQNQDQRKRGSNIENIRGMYFDTSATNHTDFLLLPEESCLAEDEKAIFHVHCEREGFRLFGRGDVHITNIPAKIYLTNYRVGFPFNSITDLIVNFRAVIEYETDTYVIFNLH
jgi:hypothetical protein